MSAKSMATKLLHTGAFALLVGVSGNVQAAPLNIADSPLFLNGTVAPMNMIIMGRDHKLYYEAYNDASDLNNDGVLDTKYKGYELKVPAPAAPESPYKIDYFGYFDSFKCYTYTAGIWEPTSVAGAGKTCSGGSEWSGDWLNYITTARIDALRKVMYGGDRSTDTVTDTVLERTYVPQDAHSWGKDYRSTAVDGYDITLYTPLDMPTGTDLRHMFANTTPRGTGAADATLYANAPLMRVAPNVEGGRRIWNWLSKERPVANYGGSFMSGTGPHPTVTDYAVRVKVCKASVAPAIPLEPNCKQYGANYKPVGLLQDYGEGATPRMYFGLMTGSYAKNTSGGVLRKKMGSSSLPLSSPAAGMSATNEIDPATGQFLTGATNIGIIAAFNRMHGTGFSASNATDAYAYRTAYTGQSCGWITNGPITEGQCQMWGNPIAEIMFESLRYFAGTATPLPAFATTFGQGEEGQLPGGGLPVATWDNPYTNHPVCTKPFQTVISDINPTYDTDQLPGVDSNFSTGFTNTELPGLNVATLGQTIWTNEYGAARNVFIGQAGSDVNSAPTPKSVSSFGNIRGLAPEDPTKRGGYYSGSVAYYGHETDLNGVAGQQKLSTFAVALASPLPKIEIPVGGRIVTLVPFAKSVAGSGISNAPANFQPTNQIVDFYVDDITATTGRFRVNFEDVEQGADHDMDAIVVYEYEVIAGNVVVRLTSEYAAGGIVQHMGYIISGTTRDGIYLEVRDADTVLGVDVDYYLDTPPTYISGVRPIPNDATGYADNALLPLVATRTFTPGTTGGAELLKNPLWYAAKWGGFKDADGNGRPNLTAEWDENGDGNPDNYFLVTNALNLGQQLASAFDEILGRVGSASSASVNAGSISSDTRVYQAKFNSGDWTGQLLSFPVEDTDDPLTTTVNEIGTLLPAEWDASTVLPAHGSRAIITTNLDTNAAVPFKWADIGATRQAQLQPAADALGERRLEFLRGDGARERSASGPFRTRPSKLGDIVSSSPIFVGKPPFLYPDSLESVAYSTFVTARENRPKMVYVGANDGMLHAFDAGTGVEALAYIPNSVFPNLIELTRPNYSHRFYVDGTPTIADAFFGGAWHTMLVGGLNKGGRSIYALDVTYPESFSDANATSIYKWEYSDNDLGYTYSRPAIVRMANGQWAAVFGSGYNGTGTGRAYLYIVNIENGNLIAKIDTTVGTAADPNGLATPAVVDINGDSIVDYAFAGDLRGNMWKFNLTSTSSSAWDVAYVSGGVKSPLFVARDSGGVAQPITSKPEVGRGPKGVGMIVLFGTGKFMELGDKVPTQTQTFYGVIDQNSLAATDIVSGRAVMQSQTILIEQNFTFTTPTGTVTIPLRVTTQNPVAGATGRGWYMDLLSPNVPNYRGEMQVSDSVLRNGRIIFTTLIPDPDPCSPGGTSWLMEMDALTGGRLLETPFDNNRDGQFNDNDYVTVVIGGVTMRIPVSGMQSEVGIAQRPGILSGETAEYKYLSGTTANASGSNIQRAVENPGPNARGRQSWRQIK
jgi:type IV pilus assembly protein PilY1